MNFIIIPYDLLARTDLTASEKNLMGLIHSLSAKEGYCFASNQYIADALGMKLDGVRTCLLGLEKKKLITRVIKRKENNEVDSREIRLTTPLLSEHHIIKNIIKKKIITLLNDLKSFGIPTTRR